MGQTLVMVLRVGLHAVPQDVHAAPPAAPSQQEVWGRWAAEAEAGAEEVAGGALHPTLVTSCFEPRQTQRLLVPPGPAPGCP